MILQQYSRMSATEKKIADIILANPKEAIYSTAASIARKARVADGSIINFANSLGYKGFSQLKINLAKSLPVYSEANAISKDEEPKSALRKIIDNTTSVLEYTYSTINDEIKEAAELLMAADKILVFGIAPSAYVAQDVAYRLMRIGLPAQSMIESIVSCVFATQMTEKSVLFEISEGGRTVAGLEVANAAKKKGAKIICITSCAGTPLVDISDVSLIATIKTIQGQQNSSMSRITQLILSDSICSYITAQIGDHAYNSLNESLEVIERFREGKLPHKRKN